MEEDGSFFILSGNKLWYSSKKSIENTVIKNKAPKGVNKVRNAAKNKRIIEFPLFEEILKTQTDPYWISFFDDCAIGKLPRGFKYINNVLYYRIKSKTLEVLVPEEPLEAEIIIKKFIFEHAGIISPVDLNEKRAFEECKAVSGNQDNNNWNNIKNEKERAILISTFVERVSECFNLSKESSQNLSQIIKLSIYSGFLNSDNIIMENGNITEIVGLEFSEQNQKFLINDELRKNIKINKKVIIEDIDSKTIIDDDLTPNSNNKKCLIKQWNKYLNEIGSKKFKH
jgi:hypothetical protein